ncbi:hypothetical protein FOFC_18302 [Fusarium oxysporum]|nr:hypothetical protein FOFC_18302 [Fusarium oxysporum]
MLLPATHSLSHKRSRSNTLGDEGLRPHCDLSTAHPTLDISNDVYRSLDIRVKKNKPEGVLDNAIANDNIPHGDLATNHSTEGRSATNESLTDEGIDDDFTDEGLTDEGIGDDESTCSTKPIQPGDIKSESLWGRKYPINEWQPHDQKRTEAWELSHELYSNLFGTCETLIPSTYRVSLRPITVASVLANKGHKCALDVGPAGGNWAMDFADEHPGLYVISVDLSTSTPEWVPPNLTFQTVERLDLQDFSTSSMDFIHFRELKGRISHWREFLEQVFNVLKPGGVAEFHEEAIKLKGEEELPKDGFMVQWGDLFREAGARRGADFEMIDSRQQLSLLRDAGFSDIKRNRYKVPIGPWHTSLQQQELGRLAWKAFTYDIEGSILRPAIENLGWSEEECQLFAANLRNELQMTTVKPYMTHFVVVCKKP